MTEWTFCRHREKRRDAVATHYLLSQPLANIRHRHGLTDDEVDDALRDLREWWLGSPSDRDDHADLVHRLADVDTAERAAWTADLEALAAAECSVPKPGPIIGQVELIAAARFGLDVWEALVQRNTLVVTITRGMHSRHVRRN